MVLALLYDVEANLPALDAVINAAQDAGATGYLIGGDAVSSGPWPADTLSLLRTLPKAKWLRGNGERWIVEPPPQEFLQGVAARARAELEREDIEWLYSLPHRLDCGDVVFCHASPASDERSFAETKSNDDEQLLAGVDATAVCFGHMHVQFRRKGPRGIDLINAGSVGMPWDGDRRAAWAFYRDGDFDFRRTEYDVGRAIAGARAVGDDRLARAYESASR